jgi:acetoacetyl-CoA synthetase
MASPPAARVSGQLVLLKPGTGDPLFIVHGLGGMVSELMPLGSHMSSLRPVYGFQARHLDIAPGSIEQMASSYLRNIREVQPHGPYLLTGYSFGGVVALEMAHQLLSSGEKVALLAFLDSYPHPRNWPLTVRISVLRKRIVYRLSLASKAPISETTAYYARGVVNIFRNLQRYRRPFGPFGFRGSSVYPPEVRQSIESCEAIWIQYRPRFYPGKIIFVKASTGVRFPNDPAAIWSKMVHAIEVHTVSGEHLDLMDRNVRWVADRLSHCIDRALIAVDAA